MANFLQELSWSTIEYIVTTFEISVDGKKTKLNAVQVKNLYLEKDFDDLMMPIFLVSISIPEDLYYSIRENYDKTTFTVVIHSQKRGKDGKKPTNKAIYLSDIFVPMGVDGTPFTNREEYAKTKRASSAKGGLEPEDLGNDHTFILGKRDNTKNIKKIRNAVLSSATMTDAVAALLSSCGVSRVLMSIMDNTTSYPELVLLPIPMIDQLAYLNRMFGFYKEGAQIFYDFNVLYILRNCAKCTAYEKNEMKDINFVLYKTSGGNAADRGSCEYKGSGYINMGSSSQFHIEDQSKTSDAYLGNNSLIINDNGTITNATTNDSGSFNVITTTTHNQFIADETKLRLKELQGVVTLNTTNIDLRYLAPNKNYRILSDDSSVSKQVNHPFRLARYSVIFAKEGDTFSPAATITLKKTEG